MPNSEREPITLWKMYQNSTDYLTSIHLFSDMPTWVKMYEGDQWPAVTDATRNMPRPVINIIKMICRNKKSGVLSSPVRLHYESDDDTVDSEKFEKFGQYITKEIKQDDADSRGIADAVKKGTYVFHYYWNKDARGKKGLKEGALRVENIEPLNLRVANPNEPDEQKQKWLMIVSREDLDSVLERADAKYKGFITKDESDSPYDEEEQKGSDYVTVLTRYFKKDGEVYFEQGTKYCMIADAVPLTPKEVEETSKEEDVAEDGLPDTTKKETAKPKRGFEVYPVVVGSWEERDKCIYGIGEVESLIPNQKAINSGMALQLKKIQDEAWGKWKVAPDALNGQVINNLVGQVLTDHSKTGNGINKIQETPMSGQPMNLLQALVDQTRMVTGSSEVMTGEIIGSNMSGSAIATLQSQALKPIEELQQRFWRVKEKQGLVLAEFYRFFYDNKEFSYKVKDAQGKEQIKAETFKGSEYLDTDFHVVVQAGAAASFSDAGNIAMLEGLASKGIISFKTMIECYPDDAISNKDKILEVIEMQEKNDLNVAKQQLEAANQRMLKAAEIINAQSQTVEKAVLLINENKALKERLISVSAECIQKVNEANQALIQANTDAAEFARLLKAQALQEPKAQK